MSAPRSSQLVHGPRADTPDATTPTGPDDAGPNDPAEASTRIRRRRQINHDIRHELSTIMLLASLLSSADDVGPDSRERARQILGETRWLNQLVCAFEETLSEREPSTPEPPGLVSLDRFAAEVVGALQMSTFTQLRLDAQPAWAHVDALAYWRALRNIVGNAVRAAGAHGLVEVRVRSTAGWAVAQVDDDGPGFGAVPPGLASLGLGIVQDLAATAGGALEIHRGMLGGCCVTLRLPAAVKRGD